MEYGYVLSIVVMAHVVGLGILMKKVFKKKTNPIIYNEKNYEKAKGMEFFITVDGTKHKCFIANVDLLVGLTVKDINDPDPKSHKYCYRTEKQLGNTPNPLMDNEAILKRLNYFSKFENNKKGFEYDDFIDECNINRLGSGICPF